MKWWMTPNRHRISFWGDKNVLKSFAVLYEQFCEYCIIDSTYMNLIKLQETVKDREACYAAVHGVAKSWTWLSDWTELNSFPGGSDGKESVFNARDVDLIPRLGRSPGEGNGNPLQYSCLYNPMDRGAWWAILHRVTKRRTWLSDYHTQNHMLDSG